MYGPMEKTSKVPRVFVIADSFGKNKGGLIAKLKSGDVKGHSADLMKRIPEPNWREIQPNSLLDKILIFANFAVQAALSHKAAVSRSKRHAFSIFSSSNSNLATFAISCARAGSLYQL